MNWFTGVSVVIIAGSALAGANRRFGKEFGTLIYQLASIGVFVFSMWIAWITTHALSHSMTGDFNRNIQKVVKPLFNAWHNHPDIGTWLVFIVCYLVVSAFLHRLLRIVVQVIISLVPGVLARSQVFGAVLGVLAGVIRVTFYGAGLFLVIQYFSVPFVAKEANTSSIYQYLSKTLYRPFLQPFITHEFPVLESSAIPSVARSINLFTVPSGTPGHSQGVVFVPKSISDLSRQLTSHVVGDREKAYVLYEWEIRHIAYDWNKYDDYVYRGKWDEQSPEQTLLKGKGVCADYALLYADLAHASGLTVKVVEGMGGEGNQIGSHAWNAVWDSEHHEFINLDTTWGREQDIWFAVPSVTFGKSHFEQNEILIKGGMI